MRTSVFPFFLTAAVLFSCAGIPAGKEKAAAPLWVTDTAAAYPNSEWLCVVERERDPASAERAALSALAQVFSVDLHSVTAAGRQFADALEKTSGKIVSASSESRDFAQELVSTSAVSGLVGVQTEIWTAADGSVYANARMNRRECSARYAAIIQENDMVIGSLKETAEKNPGTFEAYQALHLAHNMAAAADYIYSLLTVLDTSAISRLPAYGSAEAVQNLVLLCAQTIIITVDVTGDTSGRIAGAFASIISSRGFKTTGSEGNPYTLSASVSLEEADLGNPRNKFVRYVLNYTIKNNNGVEIFSRSENGREGHLTEAEAAQRAIRAAERSINTTGFARDFDTYLASLL